MGFIHRVVSPVEILLMQLHFPRIRFHIYTLKRIHKIQKTHTVTKFKWILKGRPCFSETVILIHYAWRFKTRRKMKHYELISNLESDIRRMTLDIRVGMLPPWATYRLETPRNFTGRSVKKEPERYRISRPDNSFRQERIKY